MRLSPKGRHAVTALLDLALHQDQKAVPLAEITARQNISGSYLEQLFRHLRQAGVVHGTRGPGGGYRLARVADEITVGEIIRAVEGESGTPPAHAQPGQNLPQQLWQEVSQSLYGVLDGMTLGHLVRRPAPGRHKADLRTLTRAHEERTRSAA
ncbi:Rrf2 family transcriptional regulator [Ectothiorhodospiraceae bacterium 2226]|nr:Rrf2 family transcriptional regulator [Ectothiorhodospiraceae bacterium 2226]